MDTSSTSTDEYQDTDRVVDSSTVDNDTYNLTLVATATPQTINVENVNVTINNLSSVALTASSMTGVDNLTVTRGNVSIGGTTLSGNKAVDVDALNAADVVMVTAGAGTTTVNVNQAGVAGVIVNADAASGNTTIVGAATVLASGAGSGDTVTVTAMLDDEAVTAANALIQNAKAVLVTTNAATVTIADNTNKFTGTIEIDAENATAVTIANARGGATVIAGVTSTADSTITVNNIDSSGATILTGTGAETLTVPVKNITINLDGTSATTDAASISGDGFIGIDQATTDLVENITLSGSTAAVTYDIVGTGVVDYTLTGSQNVTLRGAAAVFDGGSAADTTTDATTTLHLDALAADADFADFAVDSIVVGATGTARVLTLDTGANVVLATDQTTSFGVAGDSAGATISIATADDTDASGATIDITTGTLVASTNVSTLNIDATVGKLTLATALTAGATTTVNISGTKDVTLAAVTAKTVNAGSLTGDLSISSAASTALTTVISGEGDDTISVDAGAAYTIVTGDGDDTVTLGANALAASSVLTGAGDDAVTVATTAAVVIATDSGDDVVTVSAATTDAVYTLGSGSDTVVFTHAGAIDLSSTSNFANFAMLDVEEVDITAVDARLTINSTAFARDNAFKITGDSATADIFRVLNTSSTSGATIDASDITFTKSSGNQLAKLELEGGVKTDTITGSSSNDTIIGTTGGDTINGGSGTDTFDATGLDAVAETSSNANSSGVVINLGTTAITAGTIALAGAGVVSGSIASVASGKVAYLFASDAANNSSVVTTLTSIENIIGSDGADYIVGTAGSNTITGGAGADTLTGGASADTFVIAAAADSSATVTDYITDFVGGTDEIKFVASATFSVISDDGTVAGAATLGLATAAAFVIDVGNAAGLQALQFVYNSNTYFAIEATATGDELGAVVIEVTGVTRTVVAADFIA